MRPTASRLRALLPALLLALAACGGGGSTAPEAPTTPDPQDPEEPSLAPVPAQGSDATLELGTWNLEWFGDPGNGPDDEDLQLEHVAHVLDGLEVDLWSLQEVVAPAHFRALLDRLPGYAGLLADDPSVEGGPESYSDFGGNELKVALLWRTEMARVESARVVLSEEDHAFAGRPPVEVRLTLERDAGPEEWVVFLLHAKAGADAEDRARREAGAEALKRYLDTTWPDARVAVLGDFNDDVDVSIQNGAATPYATFVADSGAYRFPTAALSEAGESSTVFWPDVIDHHLVTDEVLVHYLDGSAQAFPADDYLPDYGETTSDHYPVLTRYAGGG